MTLAIVGLGNPGRDYEDTRHNAGFALLGRFSDRSGIALDRKHASCLWGDGVWKGRRLLLVFPLTFMNLSGKIVPWLRNKGVGERSLLMLQDDLDTPFGVVRFREKGRSGGQNGVDSILKALATTAVPRIKVGIGRPPILGADVSQYVLSGFSSEERKRLPEIMENGLALIDRWVESCPTEIEE